MTDFTIVDSVIGCARNSASAPRASIRIDGFWSRCHCVSEPCTGRRRSFSASSTNQTGIEIAPRLPADHAQFDLAVAGEAGFQIVLLDEPASGENCAFENKRVLLLEGRTLSNHPGKVL
jgi:hypothetical protein